MKKRGLIRWNFPIYLIAVALLFTGYLFLGLDRHIKALLEQRLSALNGAPVTIETLRFSGRGPSLELKTVQFFSRDEPDRVQLKLQTVTLDLDLQAFLRNRTVVTGGQITGIELASLVFRPLTSSETRGPESIGFASDFLANPNRGQLPDDAIWKTLPSVQARAALQSEIESQVQAWHKQLDTLQKDIQQQKADLRQNSENETHAKIVQAQLDKSRVELMNLEGRVKADGNVLLGKIGTLVELVPHDMTVVGQGSKIPSLEFKTLGLEVGGRLSAPLLRLVEDFQERLLPWLESREQSLTPKMGRLQGTNFSFEGRLLPPRLWIQSLDILSKASPDGAVGDAIGKIQNLSSEPHRYPARLSLQTSFPKAELANLQLDATIDHREGALRDKLYLTIAALPVRDLDFVRTPSLRLGVEQALANLNLEFIVDVRATILNVKSVMTKVAFRNETQSESLKTVFDEALAPLRQIVLEASGQSNQVVHSIRDDLRWSYASNLSDQLRVSLQKVLSQEFAEFSGRVKERVEQQVMEARKALEAKVVSESEAIQREIAVARDL
jgi:uncharacterized protein (TIGR03545 family)